MTEKRFARFSAAKAAMDNPVKDKKAYQYKYATLAQVEGIVGPACRANGVEYVQYQQDGTLYTMVFDAEDGDRIAVDSRAVLTDAPEQERGSSETYQRRYALLTVFGLAPEDDDGKAAHDAARPRRGGGRGKGAPDALQAAKQRLWAALEAHAAATGGDPRAMAEGVKARDDAEESAAFYERVAQEYEQMAASAAGEDEQ